MVEREAVPPDCLRVLRIQLVETTFRGSRQPGGGGSGLCPDLSLTKLCATVSGIYCHCHHRHRVTWQNPFLDPSAVSYFEKFKTFPV